MKVGRLDVHIAVGDVGHENADLLVRVAPAALVTRRGDPLLTAAGPEVVAACRELRRRTLPRGLDDGDAVTTLAGRLDAVWLVHVSVPRYTVHQDRTHLLATAYRAVLAEADSVGATTVSMPALGTTPPYWPVDAAARCAVGTLSSTPTDVRRLRLMVPSAAGLEGFAEAMARG